MHNNVRHNRCLGVVGVRGMKNISGNLNSIQFLRALAATMVVVSHASTSLLDGDASVIDLQVGAYGVDIFFVISGFIMHYTTTINPISPQEFMRRRIIRIAPMYTLLTTVLFIIAVIIPSHVNTASSNIFDYLRSILYIPFYSEKVHDIRPVLGQGWTLNYEMFFYVIFAVALLFPPRGKLLLITVIMVACATLGAVFSFQQPVLAVYTDSLILEFLFGIFVSFAISKYTRKESPVLPAMIVGGWIVAIPAMFLFQNRVLVAGLAAAMLVFTCVFLEARGARFSNKFILGIGAASYSLYLAHGFVLAIIRRVWERLFDVHSIISHAAFIILCSVVAIAVALVLYRYAEKPMTQKLTAWTRRAKVPTVAPAVPISLGS